MQGRQITQYGYQQPATSRRWIPNAEQLSYTRDLLEVFVLLLALPYLIHELFHSPAGLSERMAGHHSLS